MKRKRIPIGLSILLCLLCAFALISCDTETPESPAHTHVWGEWEESTPAGCATQGVMTRACTDCKEVDTETAPIPATGAHVYGTDNGCTGCDAVWQYTAQGISYTNNTDGITCTVSGVTADPPASVILPYYHNGKRVTAIGPDAFRNCDSLTSVTLPDSVTDVGDKAFYDCDHLCTVTLGATSQLERIGNEAFYSCEQLAALPFGENSRLTAIGEFSFGSCHGLTAIVIPNSVTSIGNDAFNTCSHLTTVTFGANSQLTSLGDGAFYDCDLLTAVTLGTSGRLTHIGDYAFAYSELTSITIPDSVTFIGMYAFQGCTALTAVTCGATGWWVSQYADAASGTAAALTASNLTAAYSTYYWKRG